MSPLHHSSLLLGAPAVVGSVAALRTRAAVSAPPHDEQLAKHVPGVNPQLASVCAQTRDALDLVKCLQDAMTCSV